MKSKTVSPLTITRNVVRTDIRSGKDITPKGSRNCTFTCD